MCGINGFFGLDDKILLKKMCDVLFHRGPNDRGMYIDKNIGLGSTRLSIIDIKGGKQPVHNEDFSKWIVFNGEIYNFLDLRNLLENKGHSFYTNSDTEVILHAYEEFGDDFVTSLRGMFAFAIWDSVKKRLILARDRLGKKPLYYTYSNEHFIFASEIKSILQYDEIRREVDEEALYHYLSFLFVPKNMTMFKGIKKLLPGSILFFENGRMRIKKYWDLKFEPTYGKSIEFYVQQVRRNLEKATKIRLMSEVPLGAYLSGGIDSSSVVAFMSKYMQEPIKTISVGFGTDEDELKFAKITAEEFDTDHKEIYVCEKDVINLLSKIVWHLDEPMADAAVIPVYLMSEVVKKYVTVVLTGDGGDETFAGYPHYKTLPMAASHQKFYPQVIRNFIRYFIQFLPSELGRPIRYLKYISSRDSAEMYFNYMVTFDEVEKKKLLKTNILKLKKSNSLDLLRVYFKNKSNFLTQLQLWDIKNLLPEDFNMKIDKMTMANSVEARSPFQDHILVEAAAKIPPEIKVNNGVEKYILKLAMRDILPKQIIKRKKHGFNVPINFWLKGDLRDIASRITSENAIIENKYFHTNQIKNIISTFKKPIYRTANKLWALMIFDIWHKIFIEREKFNKLKI